MEVERITQQESPTITQIVSGETEIECEICDTVLKYGDKSCPGCGSYYDAQYWTDWYAEWFEFFEDEDELGEENEEDSYNLRDESVFLSAHERLCCDKAWQDCDCKEPIIWSELNDTLNQTYVEDAYRFTSSCSECIHYYEPSCRPFRSWIRESIAIKTFPGEIDDICQDFRSYLEEPIILFTSESD